MTTARWEHLTCNYEPKPHKWKRELGQRGRKPRFCPKHKPAIQSNSHVTLEPNGMRILHCELGDHDWEREPTRGRVPTSCPEHRVAPVIQAAARNENGKVTLFCEIGKHKWERDPKRGKRPANCPLHSSTPVDSGTSVTESQTPKKRGRPRIHETPEEAAEAAIKKSHERVDRLEGMLKENGTHLSQQTPYILYKKTGEKPGRGNRPPTTVWDKVAEHSPLAQAQYVNAHEADFVNGLYRYERHGKVVVL